MDIYSEYAVDTNLEVEGTKVNLDKDTSLLVARWENTEHAKMSLSLYEKNKDKLVDNPDLDTALSNEIIAKTILRGWEGISYKGKPLKYSVDNAIMLLSHKDFKNKVIEIATEFNNYKAKLDDEEVKK